jgi:hypothetical protein
MRDRKERGRYSASRCSGSIRSHGGLGSQENIPCALSYGPAWSPGCTRDWRCQAGRTNEHLKQRVRDSIQQQGGEIGQEALAKLLKLLRYVGGDYEKAATFELLKKMLGSASRPAHCPANSTQSLYKRRRISGKIELHQGCARHCREALWTRPCLGQAVECRTSCGASGIENLSHRPLPR